MVSIAPGDTLYRRLAPGQVTDGLVNSAAFSGRSGQPYEVSVDLARLTDPARVLRGKPTHGLGVLLVGDIEARGFRVVHDPIEGNEAHCLIVGEYTKPNARFLANMTRVLIPPAPLIH